MHLYGLYLTLSGFVISYIFGTTTATLTCSNFSGMCFLEKKMSNFDLSLIRVLSTITCLTFLIIMKSIGMVDPCEVY
jgi:hypothetical protein